MNEDVVYKLLSEIIKEALTTLEVGGRWNLKFAIFEKTGEKEITLKMRIAIPGINIEHYLETVKEILSDIGYSYKIADDVVDAGMVVKIKNDRNGDSK